MAGVCAEENFAFILRWHALNMRALQGSEKAGSCAPCRQPSEWQDLCGHGAAAMHSLLTGLGHKSRVQIVQRLILEIPTDMLPIILFLNFFFIFIIFSFPNMMKEPLIGNHNQ